MSGGRRVIRGRGAVGGDRMGTYVGGMEVGKVGRWGEVFPSVGFS